MHVQFGVFERFCACGFQYVDPNPPFFTMDARLLALETATDVCSAALMQEETLLAEVQLHRPRVHAERLAPLVHDLLARCEVAADDLDAVAVSMGPGSYTGLRIGVSTAKGLALATDAALIGVPTLEALAASIHPYAQDGDVVSALLDARRNEVYAAAYRIEGDALAPYADTVARSVEALTDWLGTVEGTLWLVGDGTAKAAPIFEPIAPRLRVLSPPLHAPSAAWVARCGWPRLARGATDDLAAFEPYYLKDFAGTPPAQTPLERLSF